MTDDDVLREIRATREAFARAHGYDIRAMADELRRLDAAGDWPVVRRPEPTKSAIVSLAGG